MEEKEEEIADGAIGVGSEEDGSLGRVRLKVSWEARFKVSPPIKWKRTCGSHGSCCHAIEPPPTWLVIYMDNLLIFSPNDATHTEWTKRVLQRMKELDLHLKLKKCNFTSSEVEYLSMITMACINQGKGCPILPWLCQLLLTVHLRLLQYSPSPYWLDQEKSCLELDPPMPICIWLIEVTISVQTHSPSPQPLFPICHCHWCIQISLVPCSSRLMPTANDTPAHISPNHSPPPRETMISMTENSLQSSEP